jgi:phosphonatase-like hydrolase
MPGPSFSLVVFDVAGTTVLEDDLVIEAMEMALTSAYANVTRAAIRKVMGIPKLQAIAELLQLDPASPKGREDREIERIHEDFVRRLRAHYREHPAVREAPGARDTFAALHADGVAVALDTGFDRPTLELLLERLGWSVPGLVDCIVTSDAVPEGRPGAGLIRRAMQVMQISDPLAVVKVGDTPSDIQSGRAAGCGLVVGVSYGTHTRDELLRYQPAAVIDSLPELVPMVVGADTNVSARHGAARP